MYVYSKPEWTALVTRADTGITQLSQLKGRKVAATRGTDPFVFLLRALDSVGLSERDVELVPLQHADGKAALERGDVDAWAGLDPLMAASELKRGARLFYRNPERLFYRNPEWNTYGVLNVREEFANKYPTYTQIVVRAYERARATAQRDPAKLKAALASEARLSDAVAALVLKRTDLSNAAIGDAQKAAIADAAEVLKRSAVVKEGTNVASVADARIDSRFSAQLRQ